jgi:hypothetical protein
MFEVEDAEFLKDIASDLLVVACTHLSKGMCGLLIPFLALGDKFVKEGIARSGSPQEDTVEKRFHGHKDLSPTKT